MRNSSKAAKGNRTTPLPEFEFELASADLVADLLDEIQRALQVETARVDLTKAGLAERMDRNKSEVTRLLSGHRNLTLQTVARIVRALDHQVEVKLRPLYTPFGSNEPTYHEINNLVQSSPPPAFSAVSTTAANSASLRESVLSISE